MLGGAETVGAVRLNGVKSKVNQWVCNFTGRSKGRNPQWDRQLAPDEANRLWERCRNEEEIFNNRLNFFLVSESVLLSGEYVLSCVRKRAERYFREYVETQKEIDRHGWICRNRFILSWILPLFFLLAWIVFAVLSDPLSLLPQLGLL